MYNKLENKQNNISNELLNVSFFSVYKEIHKHIKKSDINFYFESMI